ncbi:oxidoreductase-like domain-containing protein [Dyella sp.]|uniref:oxidoreductase-like domain-containing protein n=1 Tax=Dyella sp. TaxID=1869338 RepID=UPI002ED01993
MTHDRADNLIGDPRPLAPVEPDAGDCCGEGCVPCIFDIYEDALVAYRRDLSRWRRRHPDREGAHDAGTGNP